MIPYGRQIIDEDDIQAVVDVLRGDWLTQGPTVEHFERAIAEYVGAKYAVAFSSGTAALHGAAAAAEFGPGDSVVTSSLTFMASANCARYVGATPALVDIDPTTWNLDLSKIQTKVEGVVVVHYAGLPVDLSNPGWMSRPRVVIEDAAHALGAMTPDGPIGNCTHSDMCCFSFHPVKPITTGEGGMVTTNSDELAARLRRFRSHGIVRKPELGEWFYEISEVGFNYRLTDIQAALGLSQVRKLEQFTLRRNEIAAQYRESLGHLPIELPPPAANGFRHSYHLFPVLVPRRPEIFSALRASGVGVQVHYVPIHHHPLSRDVKQIGNLDTTDRVYSSILSLPIYPGLSDEELEFAIAVLTQCLE